MLLLPFQVDFDITLQCMYSCKHCNVDGGARLPDEMTTEQIIDVLDQLYEIGVCDLSITGGEPLLRKDVHRILKHASGLGFNLLTLNTNGLLVTDTVVRLLEENCQGLLVSVSLDGYDPRTYSILRRSRSRPDQVLEREFRRVLENLRRLAQSKVKVGINYTVTRSTINNFLPTYDLVQSLGIKNVLAIKFFPYGAGGRYLNELELPYASWADFLADLTKKRLTKSYYEGIQVSILCPWEIYLPLVQHGYDERVIQGVWDYNTPLKSELYRRSRNLGCHAGVTSCAISPNGDVYPCGTISSKFPPLVCGNLQKQRFIDIWQNSPVLRALRSLDVNKLEGHCPECWAREVCGGGCRLRAFVRYQNLTSVDYLCPMQARYLPA